MFGRGFQQRIIAKSEREAFRLQDVCSKFLADIGLTILVECHQLVKTVDHQLHVERCLSVVLGQLRKCLIHIIVFGYSRFCIRIVGLGGKGDHTLQ